MSNTKGPWLFKAILDNSHRPGGLIEGIVTGDMQPIPRHMRPHGYQNDDTIKETTKLVALVRGPDRKETEANARLIAAAPELKLACEGALTALLLAEHVDKRQAINYLKEVLAKVNEGAK